MTSRQLPRAPRRRRGGTNFWDFLIFILSMGMVAAKERRARPKTQGKPGLPKSKQTKGGGGAGGGGGGSPTTPKGAGGGSGGKGDRKEDPPVYGPFDPAGGEEDAEEVVPDEDVSIDDDEPDDDTIDIDGEWEDQPAIEGGGDGGNDQ